MKQCTLESSNDMSHDITKQSQIADDVRSSLNEEIDQSRFHFVILPHL